MPRMSEAVKKPYQPPQMTIYGDLTEMTKARPMGTGQFDNVKKTMRT